MIIEAGRYAIELKELGWWDREEIKSIRLSATKINAGEIAGFDGKVSAEAKKREIELSIVSIKEGGTTIQFSDTWLRGLTNDEGKALESALSELDKKK